MKLILNFATRTILIIYAVLLLIMCVFIVPIYDYFPDETLRIVTETNYAPIWTDGEKHIGEYIHYSAIDYNKLFIHIFTLTVILVISLIIANSKKRKVFYIMSDYCLDCLNDLNESKLKPKDVVLSKDEELCEGCGEFKIVVETIKD